MPDFYFIYILTNNHRRFNRKVGIAHTYNWRHVFTAFEAFETNTFYHEYFEDKTFRNTVDVYTGSGTWELSGERLNQFYTTESGELHFKVLEISDDELHLLITNENLNIIFTFKKVWCAVFLISLSFAKWS